MVTFQWPYEQVCVSDLGPKGTSQEVPSINKANA